MLQEPREFHFTSTGRRSFAGRLTWRNERILDARSVASRTRKESQKLSRPNPLNTAVTIDYHSGHFRHRLTNCNKVWCAILPTVTWGALESNDWMSTMCVVPLCRQFVCKVMPEHLSHLSLAHQLSPLLFSAYHRFSHLPHLINSGLWLRMHKRTVSLLCIIRRLETMCSLDLFKTISFAATSSLRDTKSIWTDRLKMTSDLKKQTPRGICSLNERIRFEVTLKDLYKSLL